MLKTGVKNKVLVLIGHAGVVFRDNKYFTRKPNYRWTAQCRANYNSQMIRFTLLFSSNTLHEYDIDLNIVTNKTLYYLHVDNTS